MKGVRHARLKAALIAALGMHALLLIWYGDSTFSIATDVNGGLLQVALLPSQQKESISDVAQSSELISKPVIEKTKSEESLQHEDSFSIEPEIYYEEVTKSENVESAHIEESEDASSTKQLSSSTAMALVPTEIQATILANVNYPRQARRRGWQGEAEFSFNVNNQSIQHVTMLASTGYPILDRAAHLGLVSMRSLPLRNGDYRLPVVFRLQ